MRHRHVAAALADDDLAARADGNVSGRCGLRTFADANVADIGAAVHEPNRLVLAVDGNARACRSRRYDLVAFVALGELDVVHVRLLIESLA